MLVVNLLLCLDHVVAGDPLPEALVARGWAERVGEESSGFHRFSADPFHPAGPTNGEFSAG